MKDAAKVIAEGSMSAAAIEAIKEEDTTDIGVSVDATWQKRGFSSLNGVVAAIATSNFKVLDVETMWRIRKACVLKDKLRKENPNEYEQWKVNHEPKCNANYEGSSGGM